MTTPQQTRTRQKKHADELFSRYVRLRDQHCQRCGSAGPLDCSHHISRSYLATRFEPLNACAHCKSCHLYLTHHPLEHREWAREHVGPVVFDAMARHAMAGARGDLPQLDYAEVLSWLGEELSKLEAA